MNVRCIKPLLLAAAMGSLPASAAPSPHRGDPLPTTRAETEAVAAAFHARVDADHDGYVTAAEIDAFARRRLVEAGGGKQPERPLPSVARFIFARADTDHDGRLSLAEATAEADRTFDAEDADHDGIVTPAERLAYLRRFMLTAHAGETLPVPD